MLSLDWLKATHYSLSIFRGVFQIIQNVTSYFIDGKRIIPNVKVEDISSRIEANEISIGDHIETKGYFSQYSHAIVPFSYLFQTADRAEIVRQTPVPNSPLVEEQMKIGFKTMQLPVSSFPNEVITGKAIGFLYPDFFNGFIYNDINDEDCRTGKARIPFKFPDSAKPIPIIYDPAKHANLLEKKVSIRARVVPIADDPVKKLLNGETRLLFTRPKIFGNNISNYYGISIFEDSSYVVEDEISTGPRKLFNVFFEFCLLIENQTINPMEIISKSLPDVRPQINNISYQSHDDFALFLTLGNIRVVGRKPNCFGLYREMDSFDNPRKVIKSIVSYYKLIYNNIFALLRKERFTLTGYATFFL